MLEDKKSPSSFAWINAENYFLNFCSDYSKQKDQRSVYQYIDLSIVLNSFDIFIIYIFLSSDYELDSLTIWSHCLSINQLTIFIRFKTASIAF